MMYVIPGSSCIGGKSVALVQPTAIPRMTPDRSYNDNQLLLRLSAGDEAALKRLYDTYYTRLVFFADDLVKNRAQSEDIVIVAFTRYWERRSGFNQLNAILAFLYTTVRNDCYKYFNRETKRSDALLKQPESVSDDYAESRIILAEAIEYIHREIELLSPIYREVITLLFLEEVSINEAAEQLGISPENVRKRKERALEQLRNRVLIDRIQPLAFMLLIDMTTINSSINGVG